MPQNQTAYRSIELMTLVFGQDASLHARTNPITDWKELCSTLRAVGGYNNFDPERVIDQLRPLFGDLSSVEVGREASPVLYVHLPYWTHQQITRTDGHECGMGERIDDADRRTLARGLFAAMRAAGADEISDERADAFGQVSEDPYRLRFWWD